jgi:hypothetical protein
MMETKYGQAERIWVMDRGMVSEANSPSCASARRATWSARPRAGCGHHEAALLEQSDWKEVQDGLEVRLVEHPDGEAGENTCCAAAAPGPRKNAPCSSAKATRLTAALVRIDAWLRRSPQPIRRPWAGASAVTWANIRRPPRS